MAFHGVNVTDLVVAVRVAVSRRARVCVVRRLHSHRGPQWTRGPSTSERPYDTAIRDCRTAPGARPEPPSCPDGRGERVAAVDAATVDLLQILRVRPKLLSVPSFEFALRE